MFLIKLMQHFCPIFVIIDKQTGKNSFGSNSIDKINTICLALDLNHKCIVVKVSKFAIM